MIFQHTWQKVLDGTKTQTRRCVDDGDLFWPGDSVVTRHDRAKWKVGKTYAVQPGRGKKGVGRIRITNIHNEHVRDISEDDVIAEGVGSREEFRALWDSIQPVGRRWKDNPFVWVLEFYLVKESE